MSEVLLSIILWTIVGGFFGLAGGILLLIKEKTALKYSIWGVSFAAGAMLGTVFFDFIPEILEEMESASYGNIFVWTFVGILIFFVVERIFAWHHHHSGKETHAYTYSLMFGDTIHNFLDGILIASAFLVNPVLGPLAAIAVFLHEIPQEIADFGVLLHGGWSRKKIIIWSLLSAAAALIGAIGTFYLAPLLDIELPLIALSVGAFLYIALVDLVPMSLKKRSQTVINIILLILGILVIWIATLLLPHVSG